MNQDQKQVLSEEELGRFTTKLVDVADSAKANSSGD